jgi:hypothetical protein
VDGCRWVPPSFSCFHYIIHSRRWTSKLTFLWDQWCGKISSSQRPSSPSSLTLKTQNSPPHENHISLTLCQALVVCVCVCVCVCAAPFPIIFLSVSIRLLFPSLISSILIIFLLRFLVSTPYHCRLGLTKRNVKKTAVLRLRHVTGKRKSSWVFQTLEEALNVPHFFFVMPRLILNVQKYLYP